MKIISITSREILCTGIWLGDPEYLQILKESAYANGYDLVKKGTKGQDYFFFDALKFGKKLFELEKIYNKYKGKLVKKYKEHWDFSKWVVIHWEDQTLIVTFC